MSRPSGPYAGVALKLFEQGFLPLPVNGKRPAVKEWTNDDLYQFELIRDWTLNGHGALNCGVLCGKVCAVDVDVLDGALVQRMAQHLVDLLGEVPPQRIGQAPKTLFACRSPDPARTKRLSVKFSPDGTASHPLASRIEILGRGQQFVAYGIHPDTTGRYEWPDGKLFDYAPDTLPELPTDAIDRLFELFERECLALGWQPVAGTDTDGAAPVDPADPVERFALTRPVDERITAEQLQVLLAYLDADASYPEWIRVGMALHHQYRGGDEGFELWDQWSVTGVKYEGDQMRGLWRSFGDPTKRGVAPVTVASLIHHARRCGYRGVLGAPSPDEQMAEAFPAIDTPAPPVANRFLQHAVAARELTGAPPPRDWTWDQWVPRGVVTGLAGPPGIAKSTLALQLAVHHAAGKPFLGHPTGPGRAVFVTVEDDRDELHRRLRAIADGMFIDVADLEDRVVMIPLMDTSAALASSDRDGKLSGTAALQEFRRMLKRLAPTLCILDLVGDFWTGNENARTEVSDYVRNYLGRLARENAMGLMVLSHPSVSAMRDGRGFSGSTGWVGSYRSAILMSEPDAQLFAEHQNMPEGTIAVTRIKANYAPRGAACVRYQRGHLEYIGAEQVAEQVEDAQHARFCRVLHAVVAMQREDGFTPAYPVWTALGGEIQAMGADAMHQGAVRNLLNEMADAGWLERRTEPKRNRTGVRGIYKPTDLGRREVGLVPEPVALDEMDEGGEG